MIILITGTPGAGKTAHAVDTLLEMAGSRPIFVDGIPDLSIEHQPCPPVPDWTTQADDPASATGKKVSFTFPPNSIVVVDECQRVFRPRNASAKVPDEVAAFETHRHLGIDFILITQHPSLVDSNIRRLVGKHIHIRQTALGRYRYQWPEIGEPDSKASREVAERSKYKLPKRAFNLYKSAEVHTKHKFTIPFAVYIIGFCLLSLAAIGWHLTKSVKTKLDSEPSTGISQLTGQSGQDLKAKSSSSSQSVAPLTAEEYIEAQKPRIAGLMHTAPVYDEITKPQQAPEPIGCMKSQRTGCKCYTQQGTNYVTTPEVCEQIFASGLWMPWKEPEEIKPQKAPQAPQNQQLAQGPAFHILEQGKTAVMTPATLPVPAGGGPSTNPRFNPELRQQTPL